MLRSARNRRTSGVRVFLGAVTGLALISATLIATPASASTTVFPVVIIETSGGFAPPAWQLRRTPRVVVYSDGTIMTTSDVSIMRYPGPAAPTIRRKVGASILKVLAAADAAKVTDPKFDWGMPPVADAPDTVFKIQRSTRGPVTTTSIYALGIGDYGLTKDQAAARAAAATFADRLQAFDNTLVPTKSMPTSWTSTRWVFSAEPMERDEFSVVRAWIGATSLATTPLCNDLTAAENRKLVALLPKLDQSSRWTSNKRLWSVTIRPLFPHETGCAALSYGGGW